jgi:hypothetical protein
MDSQPRSPPLARQSGPVRTHSPVGHGWSPPASLPAALAHGQRSPRSRRRTTYQRSTVNHATAPAEQSELTIGLQHRRCTSCEPASRLCSRVVSWANRGTSPGGSAAPARPRAARARRSAYCPGRHPRHCPAGAAASRGTNPADATASPFDRGSPTLWGARTMPIVVTWSLGGPLVFVEEAAEDGPALDSFLGEIGYGVVGPWWLELEGAVRSSPVVVPRIFGHRGRQ